MTDFLLTLSEYLLKGNDIFTKGEYYFNQDEFNEKGISDHFLNAFYIRCTNNNQKYRVRQIDSNAIEVKSSHRAIFQIDKKYDQFNAMIVLVGQLQTFYEINITSYTDDNYEIFRLEKNKLLDTSLPFNLIAINFDVTIETFKSIDCDYLCKEGC